MRRHGSSSASALQTRATARRAFSVDASETHLHLRQDRTSLDDALQQLPHSLSEGDQETRRLPVRLSLASRITMKKGSGGAFQIVLVLL